MGFEDEDGIATRRGTKDRSRAGGGSRPIYEGPPEQDKEESLGNDRGS